MTKRKTLIRCLVCCGINGYWVNVTNRDKRAMCDDCYGRWDKPRNQGKYDSTMYGRGSRSKAFKRGKKKTEKHIRVANILKYGPIPHWMTKDGWENASE